MALRATAVPRLAVTIIVVVINAAVVVVVRGHDDAVNGTSVSEVVVVNEFFNKSFYALSVFSVCLSLEADFKEDTSPNAAAAADATDRRRRGRQAQGVRERECCLALANSCVGCCKLLATFSAKAMSAPLKCRTTTGGGGRESRPKADDEVKVVDGDDRVGANVGL